MIASDQRRQGVAGTARVLCALLLVAATAEAARVPDAVVAADGSGNYRTIQQAIDAVPQNTRAAARWVIFVKAGIYRELVYVQREKRFVTLVGEDPARTVITYDLAAPRSGPDGLPIGTFRTATAVIDADDFSAENLTFENAAGPVGQALAIRVDGDRVTFRNCRFLGWQDTVFLNRGRHYFEDSLIAGHVDFVFGGATAFFERCRLHAWRNGYLTAASTPAEQSYGFVFANGTITAESAAVKTYLGRPWRDHAHVAFLHTVMTDVVSPAGWHNWDKPEREKTSRFGEFGTTGPGANAAVRAAWARRLTPAEAASLSVEKVLAGVDRWDPRTVAAMPSPGKALAAPMPRPPGAASPVSWDQVMKMPAEWYGTAEAARVADTVRRYQRANGGWPKNVDMAAPLSASDRDRLAAERTGTDSTIDNAATVTPIRYLARVFAATRDDALRAAAVAGLEFLLAAQYPNGGWPQYFPLRADYSRAITFNDDAMINVMTLLDDAASGRAPLDLLDGPGRARARAAVDRGVDVILRSQIRSGEVLTGWCQQHDERTLAPVRARAYEHPSVASKETAAIVRFLMAIDEPRPEVVAAVDAAVAWLRRVQVRGVRVERRPDAGAPGGYDVVAVDDPAAPPIWARFYELGTDRPIFSGRDGAIRYRLADIEIERRAGYSWLGPYATAVLGEYATWKTRIPSGYRTRIQSTSADAPSASFRLVAASPNFAPIQRPSRNTERSPIA